MVSSEGDGPGLGGYKLAILEPCAPRLDPREAGAVETTAQSRQAECSSRGQIRGVSTRDLVHTWVFFPRCEVTVTLHQFAVTIE